jgi:hypothetical protein
MQTALQQLQLGTEVTWGTAVTPTAKAMGIKSAKMSPQINAEVLDNILASYGPGALATLLAHAGAGSVEGHATYEDLNYYLEAAFGTISPSGAGPYVRAGAAPLTSSPTLRKLTAVFGDATYAQILAGGLVTDLTIKGESKGYWDFTAALIGKSIADGALAALSDRTVNPILGAHTALYIDAWGGTIGTTAITATAFAFELALKAPKALLTYLGSVTPGDYSHQKQRGSMLKLTLEYNATSSAYITAILSTSAVMQRQIRIKATSGTNIMQLDFAGTAVKAPELYQDKDGRAIVDVEFEATENSGLANWFKYSNTNSVSALA